MSAAGFDPAFEVIQPGDYTFVIENNFEVISFL